MGLRMFPMDRKSEAAHLPPFNAEIKNDGNTCLPRNVFMPGALLFKHRDRLAF
jgi:hypothetical protein